MNQVDDDGTSADERPGTTTPARTREVVDRAVHLLRQHTDAGWSAIEAKVLNHALSAFRPSAPVRGRLDGGDFFVTSDILVNRIRRVVDAVPRAAAERITCTTSDRDELEGVTIQLVVAYGAPLLEVARRVHAAAAGCLDDLLGSLAPSADSIHTHVHIGDVSADPLVVS